MTIYADNPMDPDGLSKSSGAIPPAHIPDDILNADGADHDMQKLKHYAKSLPYSIEPYSKIQELLDFIILRITQAVHARDDIGLVQWDSMLTYWLTLKYPIPKEKRIRLAKLYYHLSLVPGTSVQVVATCADALKTLTRSKRKVGIEDMRLPWKPVYKILKHDLFLSRRQFEYTQISWCMGYIAEQARRFFHPAAINEMLSTFLPLVDGTKLNTILSSHFYLTTFLPLSHPQYYLPMMLRVWESVNSYMYDERMLHFLARLAEMHLDPEVSDPKRIQDIPDDERSEGEGRPQWPLPDNPKTRWTGLYKDVGIFSEHDWNMLMCKCLASMEIPLADGGSLTTGPTADSQVGFEIGRLPKPQWRIPSLARIIVYSMSLDGPIVPPSNLPTPMFSPLPSGMNTPQLKENNLGDYLSAPIRGKGAGPPAYLGGSRALDSVARLIASTEHFFHPTNSGSWTSDLSAFMKYIVYEFNKRWHEEQKADCKTPTHRRLTKTMKRELVKSLRTVTLLAMFSQDSTTVSNIQSCLKSMSVLEPDLILHPVLERAVPSLEALEETQRTMSVIKALGAIAPAIVSRSVYYGGAKHLVPILQLLIPGIDLNDPAKTLCTTAFLVEISQYIKIGDLTDFEDSSDSDSDGTSSSAPTFRLPALTLEDLDNNSVGESPLSRKEENSLLRDSTGSFPDWVASFIRRVIQLLENLPEEGPSGSRAATTEVQVIDAVTGACSQICVHLSEPLFDLVLNMVYDYASTNVRANAVRAIHQLVECVANADPVKTLAKFFPFCEANIKIELENGASSVRTTSSSTPLPSDATLHWSLAILRGSVYNDGKVVVKYRKRLLALLCLLHDKTRSKRGFSWTGKLISSLLLTLTHTYPLENKFVNPAAWKSEEFKKRHHEHWGRLYEPEEITIAWHVPDDEEVAFALEIFEKIVQPTLGILEGLLKPDIPRDAIWRNDFCRHLTIVRNAFSGIPTLMKEHLSADDIRKSAETSDILNEIPEMIAGGPPLNSGFILTDPSDPRYQFISKLKARFGTFLHDASVSLRQQGDQNTLDAVRILVRSIRTFMLEYGDSRDSYYVNESQYSTDKSVAKQYGGQKVWPRAVYVRRARFYNAARLRWNSIERMRSPLADSLIDDIVEWSMWHYSSVREASQSVLESLCTTYDGVRRRALPLLQAALEPGSDDDRMKGALWTLNSSSFGKYAINEPTLAMDMFEKLFASQHNEKPSIQDCVSTVFENCLSGFVEPTRIVHEVPRPDVDKALTGLAELIPITQEDQDLISRCRDQRVERGRLLDETSENLVDLALDIGNSEDTHWRYSIYVVRCLRTLVRRDIPVRPDHIEYFLERVHDDHPTVRYYAQRAVMKTLRNIKLRTLCASTTDLALCSHKNPLKVEVPVHPKWNTTERFLEAYTIPLAKTSPPKPCLYDKDPPGWLVWGETVGLYSIPESESVFQPWEADSAPAVEQIREIVTDAEWWKDVIVFYSEENHETTIVQDDVSCIKSIFQLLEDEPFDVVKPQLESLIKDKDQNKQRAAAEILAGLLNGSKHWPSSKQDKLWVWFTPHIDTILRKNIKSDTISIWSSFLEYIFFRTDPRRVQPLVDFLWKSYKSMDYNPEMSFDAVKVITLFRSLYEELGRKFTAWTDETVKRAWAEIHNEHDHVRAFIGEILAFSQNVKWQPKPSLPMPEVFVTECATLPLEVDIMGMRGTYHKERVQELAIQFGVWRKERLPGVRAFQSTYDRVGITICKWLYQSIHDLHAVSTFDYILPLMPELFRFTEVNDNKELVNRANNLLIRMCGVSPPMALINPILGVIFDAVQKSPSWRVRLKALPLLQVFYFRQLPLISEVKIVQMLEVLCQRLDDEVVEVREMAASTLSGILRLSPRRSVITLKDRFVRLAKNSHLPDRADAQYNTAVRQRHAAILGICALVDSYPYTVEKWMPDLLTNVLAEHTHDPIPISTTVRKCASNFKRTHQDTWHEDSKRFTDHQLGALSALLTGSSYYA